MVRAFNKVLKNRRNGFTLIELLVVVLILGILIAVAIPLYLTSVRNAGTRTVQANLKTIAQAAQAYRVKNGEYPADAAALVAEGDLTQSMEDMGPEDVSYSFTAGAGLSTGLVIEAEEATDRFGDADPDDTISYSLDDGTFTPATFDAPAAGG